MAPAFPLPGTRTREPVSTPGGMRTSKDSGFRTEPDPPQAWQGRRWRPVPPHCGHVRVNRIAPAWRVAFPVPPQAVQVTGAPPADPLPLQVGQVSCRPIVMRTCVPRMASQNPRCMWCSMSLPFCGPSSSPSRWPERLNNCEKMSRKPPPKPPCFSVSVSDVVEVREIKAREIKTRSAGAR